MLNVEFRMSNVKCMSDQLPSTYYLVLDRRFSAPYYLPQRWLALADLGQQVHPSQHRKAAFNQTFNSGAWDPGASPHPIASALGGHSHFEPSKNERASFCRRGLLIGCYTKYLYTSEPASLCLKIC